MTGIALLLFLKKSRRFLHRVGMMRGTMTGGSIITEHKLPRAISV